MNHDFHTPDPVRLYVEVGRGSIRVQASDECRERGETQVRIDGSRPDQVVVDQDGDQVSVVVPKERLGFGGDKREVHVTVSMPTGSQAVLRAGSATVAVTGDLAVVAVKSGSGDVTVERVGGQGLVETGSGDVRLESVTGELQVKCGSGDVRVGSLEGPATISTGSGDIVLARTAAHVAVKTGSGDLVVEEAADDLTMSTGSGDAWVRRALRGRLTLNGASGDVRVGIPSGTPVWTDVTTITGQIRSDLPSTGEPADGQDFIELRARTATGNVQLQAL